MDFGLQVIQISQFDDPILLKDLPPGVIAWQSFVIDQEESFFRVGASHNEKQQFD